MNTLERPELKNEETAIDRLLAEQRLLTPVARFAREHDVDPLPSKARYYRDLIPLTLPKAGEQFAFEVDLDKCSGCKACVTACHNLNGLDEEETWRSVGFLYGGTTARPFQQTVTTACHHCVDPGCLNGCPVLAYEKDPVTGIVRHLDDQCIGCQYCVLKCPYDVPKYNARQGIVRKCDMCSSRLADGEAPACVQACPTQAIRISIVNQTELTASISASTTLVPGTADSHYTLPTTRYVTQRVIPDDAQPADIAAPQPEPPHLPLVFMLVLTQMAVGAFGLGLILSGGLPAAVRGKFQVIQMSLAIGFGLIGLAASVLHLGRPLQAWRVFLGLRRSWLSREIMVFSAFAGLAGLKAAGLIAENTGRSWPAFWPHWFASPAVSAGLNEAITVIGLAGVFCSVMIYADTPRIVWRASQTATKFFGTTLLLGLAATLFSLNVLAPGYRGTAVYAELNRFNWVLAGLLMLVTLIKILFESTQLSALHEPEYSTAKRVALLLRGPLRQVTRARFFFGFFGGVLLPALVLTASMATKTPVEMVPVTVTSFFAFAGCLMAELCERQLFFTAATSPKMPGGVGA